MEAEQAVRRASGRGRTDLVALVSAEMVLELAGELDWVLAEVGVMLWPPVRAGHGEAPSWAGPMDCVSVKKLRAASG